MYQSVIWSCFGNIFKEIAFLRYKPATQFPNYLKLLKATINSGDHQESAEAMKLNKIPENLFNWIRSCNEIKQKRIAEESQQVVVGFGNSLLLL